MFYYYFCCCYGGVGVGGIGVEEAGAGGPGIRVILKFCLTIQKFKYPSRVLNLDQKESKKIVTVSLTNKGEPKIVSAIIELLSLLIVTLILYQETFTPLIKILVLLLVTF